LIGIIQYDKFAPKEKSDENIHNYVQSAELLVIPFPLERRREKWFMSQI
jgi:hypothetical protein